MSWTLRKTDRALDDLADIWNYIAVDNVAAADKLVSSLLTSFNKTCDFRHLGRAMDRVGPGIRTLPHGSYLLIYRLLPDEEVVELVRVLHGARDLIAIAQRGGFL